MNLHPLIVHFPVALLSIYCSFEFLRLPGLRDSKTFFWIKATFLLLGLLGAFAAFSTGDMSEDLYQDERLEDFIDYHESWAAATLTIFSIISAFYLVRIIDIHLGERLASRTWTTVLRVERLLFNRVMRVLLAAAGLLAIIVTGAYGGLLTHGPGVDPATTFLYLISA